MNERTMLTTLCQFLANKPIVISDEPSIRDMIQRYKNPPFTLAYRAAMRLTVNDTHTLNDLLKQAYVLLSSDEDTQKMKPVAKVEPVE